MDDPIEKWIDKRNSNSVDQRIQRQTTKTDVVDCVTVKIYNAMNFFQAYFITSDCKLQLGQSFKNEHKTPD